MAKRGRPNKHTIARRQNLAKARAVWSTMKRIQKYHPQVYKGAKSLNRIALKIINDNIKYGRLTRTTKRGGLKYYQNEEAWSRLSALKQGSEWGWIDEATGEIFYENELG